jgi:hypothetical protein
MRQHIHPSLKHSDYCKTGKTRKTVLLVSSRTIMALLGSAILIEEQKRWRPKK